MHVNKYINFIIITCSREFMSRYVRSLTTIFYSGSASCTCRTCKKVFPLVVNLLARIRCSRILISENYGAHPARKSALKDNRRTRYIRVIFVISSPRRKTPVQYAGYDAPKQNATLRKLNRRIVAFETT